MEQERDREPEAAQKTLYDEIIRRQQARKERQAKGQVLVRASDRQFE